MKDEYADIDARSGVIAWFANNPVAANLLMAIIIATGLWSALTMERAMQPDVQTDDIQISVPYPGASPGEVELGVILKIEEALRDIEAIDTQQAKAMQSMAIIELEIKDEYDVLAVLDEVKSAIDGITNMPEQAERPIIQRRDFQIQAVSLQLYGELDEKAMSELAYEVRDELIQNPDIGGVQAFGLRDYEIAIEVSEHILQKYQLTLEQVAQAIRASSIDMPGGAIRAESGEIMLRTKGQAYRRADFEKIVLLRHADGSRLLLGDIADIRDGFVEADGFGLYNNQYSVGFMTFAVGDQDIISVSEAVKQYIEEKREHLPEGVGINYWADVTVYLQGRLDMMLKNLAMGALLVFLVLALFLEIKLAFWVMIGLPICFLGTFAAMPVEFIDVNLNMFSLFGFILVLGIVVDDAIIIGESAFTATEKLGHSVDAVIRGTRRVAIPATFGVLTTIVAFMPTILADGVMAPFPAALGWVVILCLIFSLVESKLILPAHLAHRKDTTNATLMAINRASAGTNRLLRRFIDNTYLPLLRRAIAQRYVTAGIFVAVLILTTGLVAGGAVRVVLMPDMPGDFVNAEVALVEGAPSWQARDAYGQLYQSLVAVNEEYRQSSGDDKGFLRHVNAWSQGDNVEMMVELSQSGERSLTSVEIARRWREHLAPIPGADIINISSMSDMGGAGLGIKLLGRDHDQLHQAGAELETKLSEYAGVFDIRNSASDQRDEIVFDLKPAADVLGITLADIANQLRQGYFGLEVQRIQRGSSEVKVLVRYPESDRESVADLDNVWLRRPGQPPVPLSAVADMRVEPGYSNTSRIDGSRAIRVTAEVDKSFADPAAIYRDIVDNFLPELFARYPGLSHRPDGQSKEMGILLNSLFTGFAFSLFAIYALLAIPLKSYLQPLIVMGVIPFGIIGAVFGHWLMGIPLDMFSLFGIIALSGVVVNDSLIMVDFVNRSRRLGAPLMDALLGAGSLRLRAILLTSLTTFFGLLPMLLENSLQAQMVLPMATSLGFGIVFATVITLILVPTLYVLKEDLAPSDPVPEPATAT